MLDLAFASTHRVPHPIQLAADDAAPCVDLMLLAFANDPCVRWLFPDAARYREFFPAFVRAFGGKAWTLGTGTRIGQQAAALWLPPGTGIDEAAVVDLVERGAAPAKQAESMQLLEAMGHFHPQEPHWYLPLIGTDPTAQGRGLGSALLQHTLATCDADGLPAYLESTNERNVPLYRRHGFEIVEVLRVGSCPPLTLMQRPPR